ncbi:MAG TPA: S8 family peptidase [Bacteroidia bacterium]|nr:S8 family peptidase [Bacteroidia bacterium]
MKKILLLILLLPSFCFAQKSWNIPLSLYNKSVMLPPGQLMGVLVEGNPVEVAEAAKKYGGALHTNYGDICSVAIPAGKLVAFSREPGIIRFGNAPLKMQPLNDTMKVQTRITDVHNGLAPLTQPYFGDGVIMGMIDSGIDFNHPDFKDSLGRTRILYIWDQRDTTGPGPAPWNYGTLWDSAQINAGQCTHNDLAYYGHGTHVTGIAAGNGRSTTARDYSGGASHSDIIMVALDFYGIYSAVSVADAAAFIYEKAQSLGRPCVINASVGDYGGSHDGQDLMALMIDSLLDTPGRAFVCAVGNAGNEPIHLSYPLSSDTNFTWFVNTANGFQLQLWADTNNFNNAHFNIGCTRESDWHDIGSNAFTDIQSNLGIYSTDTIKNSAQQRIALVYRYGSIQGSAYSQEILVVPDSSNGYDFSLNLTGSGLFHLWSFDYKPNNFPTTGQYPKMVYYKQTDTTHTVCSSFTCSQRTITVGNYVNRSTWMDVNNNWETDTTVTAGAIMWNSSVGPTRDGRQKPDITAPGANDISCAVISTLPGFISGIPQYVGVGGFHIVGGGSSASSPVVAGSVALYLQLHPAANWQDCHDAVVFCAKQDTFTGTNLPDYTWGYGKMDAFSMMTNCALTTQSTQPPAQNDFLVFPNPAAPGQSLMMTFPAVSVSSQLEIFSADGQLVWSQQVQGGEASVVIPAGLLSPGLYLVRLSGAGSQRTQKLIVN